VSAFVVLCRADTAGECQAAAEAIRAALGTEPDGAELAVQSHTNSGGRHYEAGCHYDRELPGSIEYAFRCRRHAQALRPRADERRPRTTRGRGRIR
jgi:hypothetical protein